MQREWGILNAGWLSPFFENVFNVVDKKAYGYILLFKST